MIIYFKNKTEKAIIIEFGNDKIRINGGKQIKIDSETNRMSFNCFLDETSTFKYLPLTKSVIVEYDFVLNALYDLIFNSDVCEINLEVKQVKGMNLDCYRFIDLHISDGNVNNKEFFVNDEITVKKQLYAVQQREAKLEKKFKVADIFQSICYIGIPAIIILFGVWYYLDLLTDLCILIPLTIVSIIVGLIIKKAISKFSNKLDKLNSKFEKNTNKYVNVNSFFDKSYIHSVLFVS